MAQFIAYSPSSEVAAESVFAFVNAIKIGKDRRLEILQNHGIDPVPGEWYPYQNYLDSLKEVTQVLGLKTIFSIGKAVTDEAILPPELYSMPPEKALHFLYSNVEAAYYMNIRNGFEGHYTLNYFDVAIVFCDDIKHAPLCC